MAGNRIGRINEEIRKELSALLRTVKDPAGIGGDADHHAGGHHQRPALRAGVYQRLNCADEKGLMKGLKSAAGYLRHELGQAIDLRYTPELQFLHGRFHRPRRAHSGSSEPCEARQPRQRGHRAAGGSGMSARLTVQETADFLRTLDGVLI